MDPDPEQSHEDIRDDASQPSYRAEEPLSEASNVSLPSRQRHWMDTRLRTRTRAGGSRLHYQQFDHSETESEDERSDVLLSSAQVNPDESVILSSLVDEPVPILEMPISPLPAEEALFSENEAIPDVIENTESPPTQASAPTQIPTKNASISLAGTSAPLLTNPSLTDMLSNFPIWPLIDDSVPNSPLENDGNDWLISDGQEELTPPIVIPTNNTTIAVKLPGVPRGHQHSRPRRHPPGRARLRASLPRGHQQRGAVRGARKRGRPRGRPPQATRTEPNASTRVHHTPSVDTDSSAPSAAVTSDQAQTQELPNTGLAYDVIVPPDTPVEHVAYEIVNAIIWSTRTSQLDPGESY